jgi:hypothetical protein
MHFGRQERREISRFEPRLRGLNSPHRVKAWSSGAAFFQGLELSMMPQPPK